MRLDTTNRRRSFVADGAQPAISSDGTQLAYGASPGGLAVRELATGQTRTIRLPQLGEAANLLNASISWLADGSDVAIVPAPLWDLVGRPPKLRWCGTSQKPAVVVFVHVPSPPAPPSAHCVRLAGPALVGRLALACSPAAPTSLLLATTSTGDRTVVEQVAPSGTTAPILSISDALPVAFDPTGTHLMYLVGHDPPKLTTAIITPGKLRPGPWRKPLAEFEAAAW